MEIKTPQVCMRHFRAHVDFCYNLSIFLTGTKRRGLLSSRFRPGGGGMARVQWCWDRSPSNAQEPANHSEVYRNSHRFIIEWEHVWIILFSYFFMQNYQVLGTPLCFLLRIYWWSQSCKCGLLQIHIWQRVPLENPLWHGDPGGPWSLGRERAGVVCISVSYVCVCMRVCAGA